MSIMTTPSKTEITSIVDWFDPNNVEHIKAFQFLEQRCYWPGYFILPPVTYPANWQVAIYAKIARMYIDKMVKTAKAFSLLLEIGVNRE